MNDDLRQRYFDLLKMSLTDFLHVDSAYANAKPLEWTIPKAGWKTLRNRLLTSLLRRSHMMVMRDDRLSAAERRKARTIGTDQPPHAETMVGLKRLDNLQSAIETLLSDRIPGDVIETGVWRGGTVIFMSAVLKAHDAHDRLVWACDSFAGLPPPQVEAYPADAGDVHHTYRFLEAGLEEVKRNFEKYGLLDDRVRFVKGFFADTLTELPVERLALIRVDADMYGSTMVALEALYHKLSPGGFLIIDDYHALEGCRQAVTDFRHTQQISADIVEIDGTGIYWRKT